MSDINVERDADSSRESEDESESDIVIFQPACASPERIGLSVQEVSWKYIAIDRPIYY